MVAHVGLKESIDFEQGELILVDKPMDWTSFDVVAKIRSMFRIKKVGHAGTLDPKATGLLIVCTGRMTKSIDQFTAQEKEYTGIFELGGITSSLDSETEVTDRKDFSRVTSEQVQHVFELFIGKQKQIPPMFSAIKINGRRLYKDARKGKIVEREPREIFIKEFQMTSFELPFVGFRVVCSKGTYIRSLANDCGEKLGCGAYLKQLTRTKIGDFRIEDALKMENIHLLKNKLQTAVA